MLNLSIFQPTTEHLRFYWATELWDFLQFQWLLRMTIRWDNQRLTAEYPSSHVMPVWQLSNWCRLSDSHTFPVAIIRIERGLSTLIWGVFSYSDIKCNRFRMFFGSCFEFLQSTVPNFPIRWGKLRLSATYCVGNVVRKFRFFEWTMPLQWTEKIENYLQKFSCAALTYPERDWFNEALPERLTLAPSEIDPMPFAWTLFVAERTLSCCVAGRYFWTDVSKLGSVERRLKIDLP